MKNYYPTNTTIIIVILLVSVVFIVKYYFLFRVYDIAREIELFTQGSDTNNDKNSNDKNDKNNKMEIVVARYNEDLEWINTGVFANYPVICYNKGSNDEFTIHSVNMVIKLPNVGKCDHTYLYHIVNNYDNLAEFTMFLPGSTDMSWKYEKARKTMEMMEKNNTSIFIGEKYKNVKDDLYDFKLDEWTTSYDKNKENKQKKLELSDIRPYGKWYEANFGNIETHLVAYGAIFGVSRKHILQHTKEYYEKLLVSLNSPNPEVGHYIERSWTAIFHPVEETCLFSYEEI
jgi:hypothetical protein